MSDFFQELVGSMILRFHYQSFLVWLTASSCEHWQLIKRSDICVCGRRHSLSILSVFKIGFYHSMIKLSIMFGAIHVSFFWPILFNFFNQRFFNFWWFNLSYVSEVSINFSSLSHSTYLQILFCSLCTRKKCIILEDNKPLNFEERRL